MNPTVRVAYNAKWPADIRRLLLKHADHRLVSINLLTPWEGEEWHPIYCQWEIIFEKAA